MIEGVGSDVAAAVETLAAFGADPRLTAAFWERVVAVVLAGETTAQSCPWDVEGDFGRVEVKYAQGFNARFTSGTRRVFKWVDPSYLGAGGANVVVLVGWEPPDVYTWVVPARLLTRSRSATVTVPGSRLGGSDRGALAGRLWPMDQLLPAVLDAYREQERS